MSACSVSPLPTPPESEQLGQYTWPACGNTISRSKRYAGILVDAMVEVWDSDEPLGCLYRGAGVALTALLRRTSQLPPVNIPLLLDERICPLCDPKTPSPLRSFFWDGTASHHRQLPRLGDTAEVVNLVLTRLRMGPHEVVVAIVLLETLVRTHGALLQTHSARPLWLACCTLACKLTSDGDVRTSEIATRMGGCFTYASPLLVARIEEQLLELIEWNFPNHPDTYRHYARALAAAGSLPGREGALVPELYP